LPKKVTIYIYDQSNQRGQTDKHKIEFGHTEDWLHYIITYLAHELLHALLYEKNVDQDDVSHAILELFTDYHLRYLLSNAKRYT
jgi:hypothetical protein